MVMFRNDMDLPFRFCESSTNWNVTAERVSFPMETTKLKIFWNPVNSRMSRKRIKNTKWTMNFPSTDIGYLTFGMALKNRKKTEPKPHSKHRIENNNQKIDVWFSRKTKVNFSMWTILLDMLFLSSGTVIDGSIIFIVIVAERVTIALLCASVWTSFYHLSGYWNCRRGFPFDQATTNDIIRTALFISFQLNQTQIIIFEFFRHCLSIVVFKYNGEKSNEFSFCGKKFDRFKCFSFGCHSQKKFWLRPSEMEIYIVTFFKKNIFFAFRHDHISSSMLRKKFRLNVFNHVLCISSVHQKFFIIIIRVIFFWEFYSFFRWVQHFEALVTLNMELEKAYEHLYCKYLITLYGK